MASSSITIIPTKTADLKRELSVSSWYFVHVRSRSGFFHRGSRSAHIACTLKACIVYVPVAMPCHGCARRGLQQVPTSLFILICAGLGILIGVGLKSWTNDNSASNIAILRQYLDLPGQLWIKCLTMVVVPFMVTNMSSSVAEMKQLQGSGSVGKIACVWYGTTTILACTIGVLVAAVAIVGFTKQTENFKGSAGAVVINSTTHLPSPALQPRVILFKLIPKNFTEAMATNDFIGIIVVSIIMGLLMDAPATTEECAHAGDGDDKKHKIELKKPIKRIYHLYGVMKEMNDVCYVAIAKLVNFTPYAICSMMIGVAATVDLSQMAGQVVALYGSIWIGQLLHITVVLPLLFFLFTGSLAYPRIKNGSKACMVALSTASSAATLPVTIKCAIENNRVHPSIASFVCSLGATVNMDGTGIYYCIVSVFIMCSRGYPVGFGDLFIVAVMSTLMSCGASPIPGAGAVVYFSAILSAVGVDNLENSAVLALCVALDWLGDRPATACNVLGDTLGCVVVDQYTKMKGLTDTLGPLAADVDTFHRRRKSSMMGFTVTDQEEELTFGGQNLKEPLIQMVDELGHTPPESTDG